MLLRTLLSEPLMACKHGTSTRHSKETDKKPAAYTVEVK